MIAFVSRVCTSGKLFFLARFQSRQGAFPFFPHFRKFFNGIGRAILPYAPHALPCSQTRLWIKYGGKARISRTFFHFLSVCNCFIHAHHYSIRHSPLERPFAEVLALVPETAQFLRPEVTPRVLQRCLLRLPRRLAQRQHPLLATQAERRAAAS